MLVTYLQPELQSCVTRRCEYLMSSVGVDLNTVVLLSTVSTRGVQTSPALRVRRSLAFRALRSCLQSVALQRVSGLQVSRQRPQRLLLTPVAALHIDRRQHLELAWQRQQGEEELLKQHLTETVPTVIEVRTLAHLDQLVDSAGSAVILLYFYSKVNDMSVPSLLTSQHSRLLQTRPLLHTLQPLKSSTVYKPVAGGLYATLLSSYHTLL